MEVKFVPGDVALEMLGGPVMRVTGVRGERVRCVFSTRSGSKYRDFDSSELRKLGPIRRRALFVQF